MKTPDFAGWYQIGQELNAACIDDTLGAERWELVTYGNKLGADRFLTHVILTHKLVRPDDPDPLNWWLKLLAKEHGARRYRDGKLRLELIHRLSIVTFEKLRAGLITGISVSPESQAEPPRATAMTKRHKMCRAQSR